MIARRDLRTLTWAELSDAAIEAEICGDFFSAYVLWEQAYWIATLKMNKTFAQARADMCKRKSTPSTTKSKSIHCYIRLDIRPDIH